MQGHQCFGVWYDIYDIRQHSLSKSMIGIRTDMLTKLSNF